MFEGLWGYEHPLAGQIRRLEDEPCERLRLYRSASAGRLAAATRLLAQRAVPRHATYNPPGSDR